MIISRTHARRSVVPDWQPEVQLQTASDLAGMAVLAIAALKFGSPYWKGRLTQWAERQLDK
jgi:hypothetical protein